MSSQGNQPPDAVGVVRRRYFPAVEGMRGVAAVSVLVGHATLLLGMTGFVGDVGRFLPDLGVVIFFAISGFLLYRPFLAARAAREPVRKITPSYLWRRAVRIYPAYWVALTLLAIWPGLPLGDVLGHEWWRFYGLLQIYSPETSLYGISPAWTLCVEVSFYVALPLLAILLAHVGVGSGRRHGLVWEIGFLAVLATACLAFRDVAYGSTTLLYLNLTLLGTIVWFCVGMLLGAIQVAHPAALAGLRRQLARPGLCWPLALALFAAIPAGLIEDLGLKVTHTLTIRSLVFALIAGLVLAPAVLGDGGRAVRSALSNRAMVFLGTISYGIYLWHLPISAWFNEQPIVTSSGPELVTLLALAGASTILLATASWHLVEKPLMRRARSVKARRRSPPPKHVEKPAGSPDREKAAEPEAVAAEAGP